jgi:hypothetical protein
VGRASSGGRAGAVAGIGSSLLAAENRPQQHPRAGAYQCEVREHLNDEHHPGGLGFGGNVPETHRREDGHTEIQGVRAGQRLGEVGRPWVLIPVAALAVAGLAIGFAQITGQSDEVVLFSGESAFTSM